MSNDFWQGYPDHIGGEEQCFQYTLLGKLGFHMQKNEVAPSLISPIKEKLKMIYDLNIINVRANYKALRTKHRRKASWHWIWHWFLRFDNKNTDNKSKKKIGLCRKSSVIQKELINSENAAYGMREIISKLYV